MPTHSIPSKVKLLVSACLLGHKTRYDAGDKRCALLHDAPFSQFELVAVCPEVAVGLGTPRTPINLHYRGGHVEIRVQDDGKTDITAIMRDYCREFTLNLEQFSGVILKKNSPSCGIGGVPIILPDQSTMNNGIGEFAYQIQKYIADHQLRIPVIDEQELVDPALQQLFLEKVRAQCH